jgi:pimeloyl-ACP methyl ester carboxylesterase
MGIHFVSETKGNTLNIYLLPGLGADERLFQFLDLSGHNVTHIKRIVPVKNERIEDYVARISDQIKGDDVVLIGMSFGGVLAIELAKIIEVDKVILISSVADFTELPMIYRLAGKLRLQKLLTGGILKRSHRIMNWVMGANEPIRRTLLSDMLRDTNEDFLHWAIDTIVTWRNTTVPKNLFRIHGDRDKVLPLRRADYLIENGGHIMVANRADEVTAAIKHILTVRNR